MKTLDEITTANEETDEVNGLHLIKYTGLKNGKNICDSLENLNLSNIYENHYQLRIKNRLEANTFKWTYIGNNKELKRLASQDVIYAYQHLHKIVTIQKKMIGDDAYQISFETENRF